MDGIVVALGGGGFSMSEDGSSLIDDYILGLTEKADPRVCFVPTASGDADGYSQRFEAAFAGRADTSVLSLYCHEPWGYSDPSVLLEQDLIYVGGGSTANLLAIWRLHGMPAVLQQAAANGTILAGISAGMNCWFEGSSTDSYGPLAPLPDGLGFLNGSACPHYLGEAERREKYRGWVATGALSNGYAVDDYAAIVMRDGELVEAISEKPNCPVFRVERVGDRAVEREIPVRLLSSITSQAIRSASPPCEAR
jgi:dipeptidase E